MNRRPVIRTRFKAPTGGTGSYIIASCRGRKATVAWNYQSSITENHQAAAKAILNAMGWDEGSARLVASDCGEGFILPDCGDGFRFLVFENRFDKAVQGVDA